MASLRVAMKLSMAEAKPSPPKDTDNVSSGRKRSASTGEASVSSAGNKSKKPRREPKEGRGSGSSSASVSAEEQDEDDWDHGKVDEQDSAAEHREPAQSEDSPEPSSSGKREESGEKDKREENGKHSAEQSRTDADAEAQEEAEAEGEAEASGADAAAAQGTDAESTKRGKKRRTPSILKSLGLELPEAEAAADDGEEDGRRHGSVRSAAAVAKSKLTSKTAEGDGAKARKEKTKTPAQQLEWVQCDRCSKWRSIAPALHVDLPDQWFCEMNTWSRYNSCEVKEEVAEEEETTNDRSRSRGGAKSRRRRTESEDEPGHHPRRRAGEKDKDREPERPARKRNTNAATNVAPTAVVQPEQPIALPAQEATNWVQCNKCSKWRKVPPHIDVESLPDTWFCENNTWNPQYARCSARQETDETSTAADQAIGGRGRTKPPLPGSGDGLVVNKTCWVRCERKDCQKWRKVPEHIDMSTFPEEWYCHMNTWNPDTAFCDAREESDSESGPPNALILAPNQKVLSYRKILFGNDGKLRVCFSDKNRFNPSIFTQFFSLTQTHPPVLAGRADEDESTKPVRRVSYWWSGSYDESSALAQITAKSARSQGSVKNEQEDFSRHSEGMRRQPFYMLDAVRRLVGAEGSVPVFSLPKKASKAQRFIEQLSLFQRLRAECAVVRSCFLASQCSNLLFTKLLHMIAHSRFHNPCLDACREFMSAESLKQTLHRMEQNCELEVFQTRDSQLVACLLMSIDNLRDLLASKTDRASKKPFGEKWATPGVPLKMRKFFLKKDHVLQQKPLTVPPSAVEKFTRRPRHTTPKESTPAITRRRASSYKPDEFNEEEQKVLEESNEDAVEEESAVQTETEAIAIATVEQEVRKNLFGADALTKQNEDDQKEDEKEDQKEEQTEEPPSSMDVDERKENMDEDRQPDAVDIPLVDEMLVTEAEEKIDEANLQGELVHSSLQENKL